MNDNTPENALPPITINSQYIKDLSLEIPYAPEIFKEMTAQPSLKVDVAIESKKIDDRYNVTLKVNLGG